MTETRYDHGTANCNVYSWHVVRSCKMRAACCANLRWFTVPHTIQSKNIKLQVMFRSRAHRNLFITSVPLIQKSVTGVIIMPAISGLLRIILHSDRFRDGSQMQRSHLFQFAVSRSTSVLVQCIVLSIRFLHTIFNELVQNVYLYLDAVTSYNQAAQCTPEFSW